MPHRLAPRLVALLAVLLVTLASCGRAEEDAAGPSAPTGDAPATPGQARGEPLVFVDGFEAAAKVADEPEDLVFVYVGRHVPPCPGCQGLERRTFSQPASGEIGRRWVAARILGGEEMTPEAERFMRRYEIEGFPTLMALTAEGEVVDEDLLERQIRTAEELVAGMEEAEAKAAEARKLHAELRAKGDPASLEELAKRYAARRNVEKAVETYRLLAEKDPTADRYEALARWSGSLGRFEEERAALDHLLATWPDHERALTWRVARALSGIPTDAPPSAFEEVFARRLAALDGLRGELAAAGRRADEADVRLLTAEMLTRSGRRHDAMAHLEWVVENAADTRGGPIAHLLIARQKLRDGAFDEAALHAEKVVAGSEAGAPARLDARLLLASLRYQAGDIEGTLAQQRAVVEEAPESPQAARAREEIPALEAELEEEGADDR